MCGADFSHDPSHDAGLHLHPLFRVELVRQVPVLVEKHGATVADDSVNCEGRLERGGCRFGARRVQPYLVLVKTKGLSILFFSFTTVSFSFSPPAPLPFFEK